MSATLVEVALEPVTCCNCGIVFGMESNYMRARTADHAFWMCPNGHSQHWAQQTEAERLRDQLAREKHLREQADARARSNREEAERIARRLTATRGVVTRHKKKIAAGRCPCCSHQFKDLKTHMAKRHPGWNPEREADLRAEVAP